MTRLAKTAAPAPLDLELLEHEIKWVAPAHRADTLRWWLERTCLPDPQYPDGVVVSIYYDTPELHMLREKVDSDYLKTKIRLRWYEDAASGSPLGNVFAEAKYRLGTRRRKIRVATPTPASWLSHQPLSRSELIDLPRALRAAGARMPGPLLPVVVVRYRRRRFIEPYSGRRISLDTAIASAGAHPRLLASPGTRALRAAVVEIKGRERRTPPALRHLRLIGCHPASFSKYHACCEAARCRPTL